MSYLDRIFENSGEVITIPNPLVFTGAVKFSSGTGMAHALAAQVEGMYLTRISLAKTLPPLLNFLASSSSIISGSST